MRGVAVVGAALAAVTSATAGQEASVWAGGMHAKYADSVLGTAGMVSLRLAGAFDRVAGSVDAGVSQFASGEWVLQTSTYGAAIVAGTPTLNLGVAWAGQANRIESLDWSGTGELGPLLALNRGPFLATLGVAGGGARLLDGTTTAVGSANLALQIRAHRRFTVQGGLSATRTDSVRYADASIGLQWTRAPVAVSLSGGARYGDRGDDPWGQARIEISAGHRAVLEAAAGRYPSDIVGFTDGLFASVGVRIWVAGSGNRTGLPAPPAPVRVQSLGDGRARVRITYSAPATHLALAGDWNDWQPQPMMRMDADTWFADIVAEPGVHRFAIVVDQVQWTVPDGATSVPDEFGGIVSFLVVR